MARRLLEQQLEEERNAMTLLQSLHDSHISAEIRTNNWTVIWEVSDPLHPDRVRRGGADTVTLAESAMSTAAVELFPESNFAKSLEGVA